MKTEFKTFITHMYANILKHNFKKNYLGSICCFILSYTTALASRTSSRIIMLEMSGNLSPEQIIWYRPYSRSRTVNIY